VKRVWLSLAVVALVAVACGDDGDDGDEASDETTAATTTATVADTTTSVPAAGDAVAVRVYFARNELVATAGRAATAPAVARGALTELLAGPDDFEAGIGMTTEIPEGTELLGVEIIDGAATVDLSGDFQSGGGSLSMQLRVAEVVFTATQFSSVETVSIELDGEAVEAIGGEGVDATDLTRADFENVTPFVLVESPVPGETVGNPFAVTGISNTFEANVLYRLVGTDGTVLDDGFTTATAGTGTWGDFAFDVAFDAVGEGTLEVFEESAEDGSVINLYEVPLRLG
jgi:hypothetical protein